MPRTKDDPRNHKYRELEELFCGAKTAERKTLGDICAILGVSLCTGRKYLRNPEKMTLEDAAKLGRNLHIPIEKLRSYGIQY